jgi:hypothetical protein
MSGFSVHRLRHAGCGALIAGFGMLSCSRPTPEPQAAAPQLTASASATQAPKRAEELPRFAGSLASVERPASAKSVQTLTAVRSARHAEFDRIVFEFAEPTTGAPSAGALALPSYHVSFIDKPARDCGSGQAFWLAGDAWLEVRMGGVNAHTEAGSPTIAERKQLTDLPVLAELRQTCDFEAVVTWVLGVRSPNRFRVLELNDPPRLVVDVAH